MKGDQVEINIKADNQLLMYLNKCIFASFNCEFSVLNEFCLFQHVYFYLLQFVIVLYFITSEDRIISGYCNFIS